VAAQSAPHRIHSRQEEAEQFSPVLTFGVGERRGNQVIFAVWYSDFELEIVPDLNCIFVVDANRDEFVGVTREERCGGIINTMTGANGTDMRRVRKWQAKATLAFTRALG
jgi:hypothetical protein